MPNVPLAYVSVYQRTPACLKRIQPMPNLPLAYVSVCQCIPACLKRIQPMPNVPLAYVSVYQRISEHFIRNSYVTLIRSSVTGPLDPVTDWIHFDSRVSTTTASFVCLFLLAGLFC